MSNIDRVVLVCVGCQYRENNIIDSDVELDMESMVLRHNPVPGIDENAVGVFIENTLVGFIPAKETSKVQYYIDKPIRNLAINKISLTSSGVIAWFEFEFDIP